MKPQSQMQHSRILKTAVAVQLMRQRQNCPESIDYAKWSAEDLRIRRRKRM